MEGKSHLASDHRPVATPFVKWAGGKRRLAPNILRLAPSSIQTYFEPFLGGGAVFFALAAAGRIDRAILSDSNEELILTYRMVKQQLPTLIEALKIHAVRHGDDQDYYYQVRDEIFEDDIARAARFIYLNKTCYNGLYRVNRAGRFNVPKGRYANPTICDQPGLLAASRALAMADIRANSFEQIEPGEGDFVYCDPPYDRCFTDYQPGGFDQQRQRELRDAAERWRQAGALVMISNADTTMIRQFYLEYQRMPLQAKRVIGCTPKSRGMAAELIITNYGQSSQSRRKTHMTTPGGKANKRGRTLESFVSSLCSDDYELVEKARFESLKSANQPIFTEQYQVGTDIYGKKRLVDFILYHPQRWPECLIIQCKWQAVGGSVEQKYPFEVECIKQGKTPTIIVLDGGGYSKNARDWLKRQTAQRYLLHVFDQGELQRFASQGSL